MCTHTPALPGSRRPAAAAAPPSGPGPRGRCSTAEKSVHPDPCRHDGRGEAGTSKQLLSEKGYGAAEAVTKCVCTLICVCAGTAAVQTVRSSLEGSNAGGLEAVPWPQHELRWSSDLCPPGAPGPGHHQRHVFMCCVRRQPGAAACGGEPTARHLEGLLLEDGWGGERPQRLACLL